MKTVRMVAKKIPCGCFLAGTLIFTDTDQKAIEEIQVGDKVWAYNDTTGDYALKKVVSLFRYVRDSVYNIKIGKETIQATADHPFFIGGHWLRVAELKVGDSVKTYDGSNLAIEQITVAAGRTTVYNFEVGDYHTYYVSNTKVLVHNNKECDLVAHRREHILKRHKSGAGKVSKTEFPSSWDDNKIIDEVNKIANDPNAPGGMGKYDSPYKTGTVDGVEIRVDFYPSNHPKYGGMVSTAYPTNVAPNQ